MKTTVIWCEIFLLIITSATCQNLFASKVRDKAFWYEKNRRLIEDRTRYVHNDHLQQVKNVVIFIGDGMGISTITASRVHKRQMSQDHDAQLTFDDFPATAMLRTDTENTLVSESAAAATALFCGVRTNIDNLGVDVTAVDREPCKIISSHTPSIIRWAQEKNLKTGFVTTTRVTHATPAALYAHSRRYVEDDSKRDTLGCTDIARQLIENETGKNLNVIMGGGMRSLRSKSEDATGGRRKDGRDLTVEWRRLHPKGEFVTNYYEMMNISSSTEHVLGIFARNHMSFNADRDSDAEPSLAEMTFAALNILKRNNKRGFLLIVEGGKIDLAHHTNNAYKALDDTLAFDKAIGVAVNNLDLSQSMIIVTSDHSSALSFSGNVTPKNQPVYGKDKFPSDITNQPYQILTYASGPGHEKYSEKRAQEDAQSAHHQALIHVNWANHGAEDVPLYAIGPMSTLLFGGTFDQSYVAHAVAYAMCLFEYDSRCQQKEISLKKKESKGIDAVRQKMSQEDRAKVLTTVWTTSTIATTTTSTEATVTEEEEVEEKWEGETTQLVLEENEILRNETVDTIESSDLISDSIAATDSSCCVFYSSLLVTFVASISSILNL